MASLSCPLRASSQAMSELEFHISPVCCSSRPHVAVGKRGTRSISCRARAGSRAHAPRAVDRLATVGDGAVAPAADLVAEQLEASQPWRADRALADDAAVGVASCSRRAPARSRSGRRRRGPPVRSDRGRCGRDAAGVRRGPRRVGHWTARSARRRRAGASTGRCRRRLVGTPGGAWRSARSLMPSSILRVMSSMTGRINSSATRAPAPPRPGTRAERLRANSRQRPLPRGSIRNAQVAFQGCSGGCWRSTSACGGSTSATRNA